MSYYRHPKTRNEKIQNFYFESLKKEYKIKGKKRKLPSSWDDIRKSNSYDRSWKTYRKTQYKC